MALIINNEEMRNAAMALEAASAVNTELGDRLRAAIANEIKEARNRLVSGIHFDNGDPRGARHSIRRVIYQKILGGNINILDGKNSGSTTSYEPPRKLRPGKRGGNRMIRSEETQKRMSYGPLLRGFILRFVNSGTHPRYANGRNGKWTRTGNRTFARLQEEGDYFRGSISPRNFFGTKGEQEMAVAVANLKTIIDEEFNKLFAE